MLLVKANGKPILGVTGQLHYQAHLISFGGWYPKIKLNIHIKKPAYYNCGFGGKIRKPLIEVWLETTFDKNIPVKFKRKKYIINVAIKSLWLWNKLEVTE